MMPEFWGRGYASELTAELIKFAFDDLKMQNIIAANSPDNKQSHRVLVKNGFRYLRNIVPEGYERRAEVRVYELNLA